MYRIFEGHKRNKKGYAYVGIKGESFDGNDFYKEAIKNGATICILEKVPKEEVSAAIIVVENTIIALSKLLVIRGNNMICLLLE